MHRLSALTDTRAILFESYIAIHLVVDIVLCFGARMSTKDVMTLYSCIVHSFCQLFQSKQILKPTAISNVADVAFPLCMPYIQQGNNIDLNQCLHNMTKSIREINHKQGLLLISRPAMNHELKLKLNLNYHLLILYCHLYN